MNARLRSAAGLLKAQRAGLKIDGIGIDTWGVDYGLLDRNGRAVAIAAADRITLPKGAGEDDPGRTERTG